LRSQFRPGGIASHLKVNGDTKEKMVRLSDSKEEVHANIRRAYEDAMKMEEEERAQKQTIRYIEVGFVFLAGFVSAMILAAYNC
jgi:ribonucleotide reductase beta subunit family protein with ferritin-like domain